MFPSKKSFFSLLTGGVFLLLLAQCSSPKVVHDLSEASFTLVNQDSAAVNFPQDFKGEYVVAAFIYTHCPDVCRITTSNMKRISQKLKDAPKVNFVEITFDPKRDTPAVLRDYMTLYELEEPTFTMLTGDTSEVNALLKKLNIKTAVSYRDTTKSGKVKYYFKHTDRIIVMDKKGRVRYQYPGSLVPPKNVVEDLNKLR